MTTLQAVPGAGYPGVASLDILGSVAPYISGEEEKIEQEVTKLLGVPQDSRIVGAPIVVSAHANRVPVGHGHTVCLTVGFDQPVTPEAALEVLRAWRGEGACEGLPSRANGAPLVVRAEEDRPQARRDVYAGGGMSVVIGRLRPDRVMYLRFVALGHNAIQRAAGGPILNAEVMGRRGLLPAVLEGTW